MQRDLGVLWHDAAREIEGEALFADLKINHGPLGRPGPRGDGLLMGRGWFQADSLHLAGEGAALSRLKWEGWR